MLLLIRAILLHFCRRLRAHHFRVLQHILHRRQRALFTRLVESSSFLRLGTLLELRQKRIHIGNDAGACRAAGICCLLEPLLWAEARNKSLSLANGLKWPSLRLFSNSLFRRNKAQGPCQDAGHSCGKPPLQVNPLNLLFGQVCILEKWLVTHCNRYLRTLCGVEVCNGR